MGTAGLAVLAAVTLGVSQVGGAEKPAPKASLAVFTADIGPFGIVNALQRGDAEQARVAVSLHDLASSRTYEISGNRKPCSVVDAADYVVWRTTVETDANDDDLFTTASVLLSRSLGRVRSTRIDVLDSDGTSSPVSCARAVRAAGR